MTLKALAPDEAKVNWEKEWEGRRQTRFQRAIHNEDVDDATGTLTETIEAVLGEENSGKQRADITKPVVKAPPNTRGSRYQTIHKRHMQRFLRQPQELCRQPTDELRAATSRRQDMLARRTMDIRDIELGTDHRAPRTTRGPEENRRVEDSPDQRRGRETTLDHEGGPHELGLQRR